MYNILYRQGVSKLILRTSGDCFLDQRNFNHRITAGLFLFVHSLYVIFYYNIHISKTAKPSLTKIKFNLVQLSPE